jgi:hypothetical protein
MILAIDYDETWSADPEFWRMVVSAAKFRGHTVIGVTWRKDCPEEREHMCAHYLGLDRVLFTGGEAKHKAAKRAGIDVDVWIDDMPHSVNQTFGMALQWPS